MHAFRNGLATVIVSIFLAALCAGMAFATPTQEEPALEPKEVTLTIFARAYTWDQEAP